uniref:Zinc finger CCCH domain-containing protein 3 n=1 Tax=Hucho hucho TaxID=62062 RepID=A0A4W5RXF3_9TELE
MYFNRFGKCNRGNICPYIHDPDKVAVCTRFLRGTCKQTDGTCPFSHKVAKEKMPVCSYFLKGICNNSSCPYSHVYVSRKAAVCQDFIRGYCPQGQKCKKKHTLVCPDFSSTGSCPRGAHCKLQHRQRAKLTTPNTRATTGPSATPAKKARTKRTSLSVVLPQAQAAEGSAQADPSTPSSSGRHNTKLPSFISLSSSPEDADAPDTPPADRSEVTGERAYSDQEGYGLVQGCVLQRSRNCLWMPCWLLWNTI